ncbi:hypothetical protein BDW22DRAFT_1030630 [Trametopsis cervina]|nr:hypothetical protein BDW22DRAFT_1030630 [Trametopsis cervina]
MDQDSVKHAFESLLRCASVGHCLGRPAAVFCFIPRAHIDLVASIECCAKRHTLPPAVSMRWLGLGSWGLLPGPRGILNHLQDVLVDLLSVRELLWLRRLTFAFSQLHTRHTLYVKSWLYDELVASCITRRQCGELHRVWTGRSPPASLRDLFKRKKALTCSDAVF